jgi:hypothetical protein
VNDLASPVRLLERVNRWCLTGMTALNQDILQKRRPADDFAGELTVAVLADLPEAEVLTARQAEQLLVILGLAGASVGRHYQEAEGSHRATPERAFAGLSVGTGEPFLSYFARLAERSGTGHCHRDSFASLVRWNAPAVEVERDGTVLCSLPSVFSDGLVRTYTGSIDEQRFFGLLKASEVLERAANAELIPLSEGLLDLAGEDAHTAIYRATMLLDALRELNSDFAARPADEGLQTAHFMDVFRQFAVHWATGDIPPSGALDPEALARDLLVGIDLPSYPDHVRNVSPALLGSERDLLSALMARDSLPRAALALADVAPAELEEISPKSLHHLVVRYPVLAGLYFLLNAHARVAGVHLRLSKHFLFDPQRDRDHAGLGDPGVVSNRTGTTGMDETRLEMLTRVRHHHLLTPLRAIPAPILQAVAHAHGHANGGETGSGAAVLVRFTGTDLDPYELGLPDLPHMRRPGRHPHLMLAEPTTVLHPESGAA